MVISTIHIISFVLLISFLHIREKHTPLGKYFLPGITFKILAGIGVGLLYTYYYTEGGDTFSLFFKSQSLSNIFQQDKSSYFQILTSDQAALDHGIRLVNEPRAFFFVKILSMMNIMTLSNYWITAVYFSIICFLSFYYLGKILLKIFPGLSPFTFSLAFFFFPSIVFWSSGVLKESLSCGAIALFIALVLKQAHLNKKINVLEVVISGLLALFILKLKFYFIAVLAPAMLSYLVVVFIRNRYKISYIYSLGIYILAFGVLLVLASFSNYYLSIDYFCEALYNNYQATLKASAGRNIYEFERFKPDWQSIVFHAPSALLIGLFRPLMHDASNYLAYMLSVENLLVLVLSLFTALSFFRDKPKPGVILMPLIAYVFLVAILIAFASPNWGTLARYKANYLPYFLLIVFHCNPLIDLLKTNCKDLSSKPKKFEMADPD